ncbi:hypothetical protein ON010_g15092 [Phytophthora cinnamomi]|nr:hypothetical protein ON010_g15092 [Phytophthora cinnamomi]
MPLFGFPPALCLEPSDPRATSETRAVVNKFSSTVCQGPEPKILAPGPPTPEGIAQCDGILYRRCNVSGFEEAMCYNARFMAISCDAGPLAIKMRRRQIEQGVGDRCNPEYEAWLGFQSGSLSSEMALRIISAFECTQLAREVKTTVSMDPKQTGFTVEVEKRGAKHLSAGASGTGHIDMDEGGKAERKDATRNTWVNGVDLPRLDNLARVSDSQAQQYDQLGHEDRQLRQWLVLAFDKSPRRDEVVFLMWARACGGSICHCSRENAQTQNPSPAIPAIIRSASDRQGRLLTMLLARAASHFVKDDSLSVKIARVWTKFVDLAVETALLYRILESGSPPALLGTFTTIVGLNALSCSMMMVLPDDNIGLIEILADTTFDFLVAVGYPILTVIYCLSSFKLDRFKLIIDLEVVPVGWFERDASVIADPVQTDIIYKSLKSLQIFTALDYFVRVGLSMVFAYRLYCVVELIRDRTKRPSRFYPKRHWPSLIVLVSPGTKIVRGVAAAEGRNEQGGAACYDRRPPDDSVSESVPSGATR